MFRGMPKFNLKKTCKKLMKYRPLELCVVIHSLEMLDLYNKRCLNIVHSNLLIIFLTAILPPRHQRGLINCASLKR